MVANTRDRHSRLRKRDVPSRTPVVTGDDVKTAKPSPDIFAVAARQLNVAISNCIVVGDSVWDLPAAVRQSALEVGLLSGGYGLEELENAGALRLYSGATDMLMHFEQWGLPGK